MSGHKVESWEQLKAILEEFPIEHKINALLRPQGAPTITSESVGTQALIDYLEFIANRKAETCEKLAYERGRKSMQEDIAGQIRDLIWPAIAPMVDERLSY